MHFNKSRQGYSSLIASLAVQKSHGDDVIIGLSSHIVNEGFPRFKKISVTRPICFDIIVMGGQNSRRIWYNYASSAWR